MDPQALPFAQRIKTHALVSLVQKGLQYYQIEQSVAQVSSVAQSTQYRFLTLNSLGIGTHRRRQPFSLALNPFGHHLYPIRTKTRILRAALHDNANMAESLRSMDWALFYLLKHRPPSEAAGPMLLT